MLFVKKLILSLAHRDAALIFLSGYSVVLVFLQSVTFMSD